MFELQTAYQSIGPELLLAAAGLVLTLIGAVLGDRFNALSFRLGALVLAGAAAIAVLRADGGVAFNGLVETGPFVNYAKAVGFGMAAVTLWISAGPLKRAETIRYEFAILVIFAALGMGLTLSAADIMTLYLGIETLGLSSYVLAAYHRDNARSSEAGLKYFVLGALASGMILYGMSLVYGFTGETRYAAIAAEDVSIGLQFGLVLMITGLAFKVSAAPLHVWTPDVYEGAPTPVVAFFATAPKITAIVMFAHVLFTAFGTFERDWQLIIAIIAGASMIVGSLGALIQTNVKRLLAYSSIANIGYALVAVAAGQAIGSAPLLIFMTIYVICTLGLFAGVMSMRRKGGMVESIHELGGLIRSKPWLAACLAVLIFSVAGIPPFAGFWGKVELFRSGLQAELLPLVVILVLASVVSLGYYLRLVWIMFMAEAEPKFEPVEASVSTTVVLSTIVGAVLLFIFFGYLAAAAGRAAGF